MTGGKEPLSVPFHDDCHHLLAKYVGTDTLNPFAWFEALENLAGSEEWCYLSEVDYGDISKQMGPLWYPRRGDEWCIHNPVQIPELDEYYANLPGYDPEQNVEPADPRSLTSSDPFSLLAPEIMSGILSLLSSHDMKNLQHVSRSASIVPLSNSFWRGKIVRDMPWLYDLPEPAKPIIPDWTKVYERLADATTPSSESVIRGLANRRRIWTQTLPQIARHYYKMLDDQCDNTSATLRACR